MIRQLVRQCWFEERGIFLQQLKKVVSRDGKRKAQWFSGYAGRFSKNLSEQAKATFLHKYVVIFKEMLVHFPSFLISSTEQAEATLLPNMLQEICISNPGDGNEEGREGGEEQQQAAGHRPRGGQ